MINNNESVTSFTSSSRREEVALQSIHAHGELHGLLLNMKLRQVYRNTTKKELETIYSFPLAWDTTLLGMHVELNGKAMNGMVIEKSDAEDRYEEAINDGDLPVMLVKEGKDLYSARLGNLMPGDEVVIEIEYGQLLNLDNGRTRITIPTTIAPRFGRDPGIKGLANHKVGAVDLMSEYRFFMNLDINGPLAQGRIECPSHKISQQIGEAKVNVQLAQNAMLDRDFVLIIETADITSTLASPDPDEGTSCTVLSSFIPHLLQAKQVDTRLDLKILIDCSGSMAGESMRLAKEALTTIIQQLKPTDNVSYSQFGSETFHAIDRLVPASNQTIQKLLSELRTTSADLGGTELENALRQVIAIPDTDNKLPESASILLITDGEVWEIESIVATARRKGHQVFIIGVGSSPSGSLVGELAKVTGGAFEIASPGENMAIAAARLMAKMRSMLDLDISLTLDGKSIALPTTRQRISNGETLHLWYQLDDHPVNSPQILITDRRTGQKQVVEPSDVQWNPDGRIARIGASKRLADIASNQKRREIALKYQLLTEQTHFFLVHERKGADKAAGMPELQQVKNMLAAGWGGAGSVVTHTSMRSVPLYRRGTSSFDSSLSSSAIRAACIPSAEMHVHYDDQALPHFYIDLKDVIRHAGELGNPLEQLSEWMEEAKDAKEPFIELADMIEGRPSSIVFWHLVYKLKELTGDKEIAVITLLQWLTIQTPNLLTLSQRSLELITDAAATVHPRITKAANKFLDYQAGKSIQLVRRIGETLLLVPIRLLQLSRRSIRTSKRN